MWQSLHAITGMFKITSLMNPLKATRVSFFRSSTAFGKSLVSISSVLKLKTNYLPYTSARYTVLNWFAQSDYNKSLGFKEVWKRVKVGNICILSQKLLYAYSNESDLYNTSRQQNMYVLREFAKMLSKLHTVQSVAKMDASLVDG